MRQFILTMASSLLLVTHTWAGPPTQLVIQYQPKPRVEAHPDFPEARLAGGDILGKWKLVETEDGRQLPQFDLREEERQLYEYQGYVTERDQDGCWSIWPMVRPVPHRVVVENLNTRMRQWCAWFFNPGDAQLKPIPSECWRFDENEQVIRYLPAAFLHKHSEEACFRGVGEDNDRYEVRFPLLNSEKALATKYLDLPDKVPYLPELYRFARLSTRTELPDWSICAEHRYFDSASIHYYLHVPGYAPAKVAIWKGEVNFVDDQGYRSQPPSAEWLKSEHHVEVEIKGPNGRLIVGPKLPVSLIWGGTSIWSGEAGEEVNVPAALSKAIHSATEAGKTPDQLVSSASQVQIRLDLTGYGHLFDSPPGHRLDLCKLAQNRDGDAKLSLTARTYELKLSSDGPMPSEVRVVLVSERGETSLSFQTGNRNGITVSPGAACPEPNARAFVRADGFRDEPLVFDPNQPTIELHLRLEGLWIELPPELVQRGGKLQVRLQPPGLVQEARSGDSWRIRVPSDLAEAVHAGRILLRREDGFPVEFCTDREIEWSSLASPLILMDGASRCEVARLWAGNVVFSCPIERQVRVVFPFGADDAWHNAPFEIRVSGFAPFLGRLPDSRTIRVSPRPVSRTLQKRIVVVNDFAEVATAEIDVSADLRELQTEMCRTIYGQIPPEVLPIGFALVDPSRGGDGILAVGSRPPLDKNRHRLDPTQLYDRIQALLMQPDVGDRERLLVIVLTPVRPGMRATAALEHLRAREAADELCLCTIVIGSAAHYNVSPHFLNPSLLVLEGDLQHTMRRHTDEVLSQLMGIPDDRRAAAGQGPHGTRGRN